MSFAHETSACKGIGLGHSEQVKTRTKNLVRREA